MGRCGLKTRWGILLSILLLAAPVQAQSRHINTPHYLIQTDLDDSLARELSQEMESMYGEYSQRLAAFSRKSALPRMEVYLFRRQQDYAAFTEGKIKNTGGLFLPSRNLLAAFLEGQGRQQLRRTLQHEAFHQFAYNVISTDLPVWLNEGLAQLFEEGLWNGNGFLLGEAPPRRVRRLQMDLKGDRLLTFSTLLPMSDEQWARRLCANEDDGAVQYNQSWAIVHFLVMAQNSRGEFLYRPRVVEMLRYLHEGNSPARSFQLAFGSNVAGFQDRFVEYARTLRPTPEATMIENQGVLADLLVDLAKEGKHFEDVESFHKYVIHGHFKLHYHVGTLEWDTNPDFNVYFSNLDGGRWASDDLYFSTRSDAPLADLVCRYSGNLTLRTRFYDSGQNRLDHDLSIESSRISLSISAN